MESGFDSSVNMDVLGMNKILKLKKKSSKCSIHTIN